MLDKTLDKLRDKTLSFGCILNYSKWPNQNIQHRIVDTNALLTYDKDKWLFEHEFEYKYVPNIDYIIIWHPLTRWRIKLLFIKSFNENIKLWAEYSKDAPRFIDERYYENANIRNRIIALEESLQNIFEDNIELYDQSELERMESPHRPKLKEILIQFSNYL